MIGNVVSDEKTGEPLDSNGNKLSQSAYQPSTEVMDLFSRCQASYQNNWRLQHRPFDEFDGISLLQRAKVDQETFGAFVGAQYIPEQQKWRWRGRKNTARNKLISILAHMINGMLYPMVTAQNEDDEEDKLSAQVMRIVVENHLKKANYETKFMYFVLSALVNPAAQVEVQYLEAIQRIKEEINGTMTITDAVDSLLSGLSLNVIPIDQLLVGDFYVNDIQQQPSVIRVNRIPWDMARKIYAGRYYQDGKDLFDFVEAGKTRIFSAGQEHQTLYDIEWTEADRTAVQIITCYYRDEDLELDWVGGVGMFNYNKPYLTNRFKHRRMSLIGDEWKSIPVYPFAKTYFEPIDPAGRFYYGKSGAFKEYWDSRSIDHAYRLLQDGMTLEVMKPFFLSGVAKVDGIVIAPGAAVGMPQGATVTPFSMSPNLAAAMQVIQKNEADMSESTQDKIMGGNPTPGVTATQSIQAQNQAQLGLSVLGVMIADLVRQIGDLTVDCTIQHTLSGELDATIPSDLLIKYKTIIARTNEKGKTMTNRIHFKSSLMGKKMTQDQKDEYEWKLWTDKGGDDQTVYHVNPYKFARNVYGVMVDADEMVDQAMGNDRAKKLLRYQMLTQQFVYPFTDQKEVADSVIEEFSDGSPDRFKSKGQQGQSPNDMMNSVMGGASPPGGQPTPPVPSPMNPSQGNSGPLATVTR
jgi:hypothetical protein